MSGWTTSYIYLTDNLCQDIGSNEQFDQFVNESEFREFISDKLFVLGTDVGISEDKINAILDCLEKIYGVEFPRPPFPDNANMNSNFNWPITQ